MRSSVGNTDCDFLIVGAGLAGASTACYLRRLCASTGRPSRIVVVDMEDAPGAHSSGRNAALVRRHIADPPIAALAEQGADVLAGDGLAEFRPTGSVLVGIGQDDVSARFPLASGRGLWCPRDGVIDVAALLSSYLRGLDVRLGVEVTGWSGADGAPLQVATTAGLVTARVLVNAAGPWAGTLGNLPLTANNRHVFVTPPMNNIDPDWPFVWDLDCGFYFRPESGGLLLCACDETPAEPGDYSEDPQVAVELAKLVKTCQPGLGELRIMRSWVGQRVFAADRRFVIGYDPRDRRIFHVAALGGHGVTTSPAVGALAARLLTGTGAPADNPFDPARLPETSRTERMKVEG